MWPACGSFGAIRASVRRLTGPTTVTAKLPLCIRPSGVISFLPPYCGAFPTAMSVASTSRRSPSKVTVNARARRRSISAMIATS